jgi:hypothetical protein
MNQRLEQLALKCGAWYQVYDQKRFMVDSNFDIQKFALLIVGKCAEIAHTAEPYQSKDLILKRFGLQD